MKPRSFFLLGLSLTWFALTASALATQIINSGPRLRVVQGDVARLSAQFFDPDGNGTVIIRALDAASGQPVGQINRNDTTGDFQWVCDTTSQAPGVSTIRLTATDSAGAAANVIFSLDIRAATAREKWRQIYFGASANAGLAADDADPEGDGHTNLMEFAFGTDPHSGEALPVYAMLAGTGTSGGASAANASTAAAAANEMKAVFRRRKDYQTVGLNYIVEFSADLKTWAPSSSVPVVIADEGEMERVQLDFPTLPSGQSGQFFRIRIEDSLQ